MYRRWETKTRYYVATVSIDLLGDLVMVKRWGGLSNGRGGEATIMLADRIAAELALTALDRRRSNHGYLLKAAS